jgi:hypothetical protein
MLFVLSFPSTGLRLGSKLCNQNSHEASEVTGISPAGSRLQGTAADTRLSEVMDYISA